MANPKTPKTVQKESIIDSKPNEKEYKLRDYVSGIVKAIKTKKGKTIINISVNVRDLEAIENDYGYANISLLELKEPDKRGNTHFIVENDYTF